MSIKNYDEDEIIYINSPDTLYKLANFYLQTNKAKAIHYFNRLSQINPSYHNCSFELAQLYQDADMDEKAIIHFESTLNSKKNKHVKLTVIKKLIELYIQKRSLDSASKLLKKRLSIFGDLGLIAISKNHIKRKIFKSKYHKEYLKEYESTLFTIAYVLREECKHKKAIKYAKKLLTITKKYSKMNIAYLHLMASIYECKRDFRKADKYFRMLRATKLTPNSSVGAYEIIYEKIKNSGLC